MLPILLIITTALSLLLSLNTATGVQCELYTSVEEATLWPKATRQLSNLLTHVIEEEEAKIRHLKELRDSLTLEPDGQEQSCDHETDECSIADPVRAFVTLSRLKRVMFTTSAWFERVNSVDFDSFFDTDTLKYLAAEKYPENLNDFMEQLQVNLNVDEDLAGSGEALLRLQGFYNLKIIDLINGTVKHEDNMQASRGYNMNTWDCFELGRVAYRDKQYEPAVQWLFKSLEMAVGMQDKLKKISKNKDIIIDDVYLNRLGLNIVDDLIDDILDYMAFSAYKMDLVDYAANLTEAWLERDPNNERARENLDFYKDRLAGRVDGYKEVLDEELEDELYTKMDRKNASKTSSIQKELSAHNLRDLCTKPRVQLSSWGKCEDKLVMTRDGKFYPGLKIETLNEEPKILRIYDIISAQEAEYFKNKALPHLYRATVSTRTGGSRTSESRIAKTAWLPSYDSNSLEARVEQRLSSILNLSMRKAEHFQVVNYGLGGFYGPHMDSARSTQAELNETRKSAAAGQSVPLKELRKRDRLATILIYLNRVQAGGSTVFPRLNLTVRPIERSAVVWYNIKTNGFSDERTIHSGCPVLLGSKWIATKWPGEQTNTFIRPCKLDDNSGGREEHNM